MGRSDPKFTIDTGKRVTFFHDGSITYDITLVGGAAEVGQVVTVTADDTVGLITNGDPFLGLLILVEADGKCTVQLNGMMDVPTDGDPITFNSRVVGGTTNGTIRAATTGDEITGQGVVINDSVGTNTVRILVA
jgi:hypothetical protein